MKGQFYAAWQAGRPSFTTARLLRWKTYLRLKRRRPGGVSEGVIDRPDGQIGPRSCLTYQYLERSREDFNRDASGSKFASSNYLRAGGVETGERSRYCLHRFAGFRGVASRRENPRRRTHKSGDAGVRIGPFLALSPCSLFFGKERHLLLRQRRTFGFGCGHCTVNGALEGCPSWRRLQRLGGGKRPASRWKDGVTAALRTSSHNDRCPSHPPTGTCAGAVKLTGNAHSATWVSLVDPASKKGAFALRRDGDLTST